MIIATDSLSLVFIFCFLLGFGFFIASTFMGGHGHGHAHTGHAGHAHTGHVHAGHAHVSAHANGHAHASSQTHAHAPTQATGQQQQGNQGANQQSAQPGHFAMLGYLNPTSIALFLLGFGFSGYFFHNTTAIRASLILLLALIGGLIVSVFVLLLLNRLFANSEGSTEQDVTDRTGMIGRVSITIPEKGLGEIIYTSPGGMHKSIPARGLDSQRVERDLEVVVVNYQNGVADVDTWEHFMQEGIRPTDPLVPDELTQLHSLHNESSILETELVIRTDMQKE